jgi:hypothetical protein
MKRSWIFWAAWMAVGLAFEIWALIMEYRTGDEPLTRVLRDRLMRHRRRYVALPIQILVFAFLAWLTVHFAQGIGW